MNDVSGNSEVKKRKGPSAAYQKARRQAIAAGTWKGRKQGRKIPGDSVPYAEPESSPSGPPDAA